MKTSVETFYNENAKILRRRLGESLAISSFVASINCYINYLNASRYEPVEPVGLVSVVLLLMTGGLASFKRLELELMLNVNTCIKYNF